MTTPISPQPVFSPRPETFSDHFHPYALLPFSPESPLPESAHQSEHPENPEHSEQSESGQVLCPTCSTRSTRRARPVRPIKIPGWGKFEAILNEYYPKILESSHSGRLTNSATSTDSMLGPVSINTSSPTPENTPKSTSEDISCMYCDPFCVTVTVCDECSGLLSALGLTV